MAGSITVSSITLDSDNNFSIKSNTGATLFFANTSGVDIANSIGATAITNDKILSVANTKISGNIISSQITSVANTQISGNIASSQITSNPTLYGNVSVTGVIAVGGATPTTNGSGITFPASQSASTNANTLDDYEEGTWTPQAGSESGAFTATYTLQGGKYVKIGNRVWATFDIQLASRTLTGSIAFVYGLPFAVANNGDLSGSFGAPALCGSPGSNFYQLCLYGQNNASYMYITCTTSNTSGISVIPNAFWGASTRLAGGVVYNTTD